VGAARPAAVLDPATFRVQGPVLSGHNSFPSGHSITIFLVVSVLILADERLRTRPLAALGLLCAGLLVSCSRIMVGAHWPSDVLGGAVLGMLAGALGALGAERWRVWSRTGTNTAFALIVLVCAAALAVVDTGYPLAQPLQWAAVALGASSAAITIGRALSKRSAVPPS
jgi:peptidoglycan/LPS O-acetylase OafA/YrhL